MKRDSQRRGAELLATALVTFVYVFLTSPMREHRHRQRDVSPTLVPNLLAAPLIPYVVGASVI